MFQVTENTAIILDECGILTTYRGETFVKGRGYIRTYFVPLDEHFNLVKKQNSYAYYNSDKIGRQFSARSSKITFTSDESETIETISENSTSNIKNFSADEDDIEADVHEVNPNSFNFSWFSSDLSHTRESIPFRDDTSYSSTEPDIVETRC